MTPKEKAKELCNKFSWEKIENGYKMFQTVDETKRCALIAVDEILNLCWNGNIKAKEYWEEAKQEILNL
jgi:hypothetical protein